MIQKTVAQSPPQSSELLESTVSFFYSAAVRLFYIKGRGDEVPSHCLSLVLLLANPSQIIRAIKSVNSERTLQYSHQMTERQRQRQRGWYQCAPARKMEEKGKDEKSNIKANAIPPLNIQLSSRLAHHLGYSVFLLS